MPELPEVETIKRDLLKLVIGKKILDIATDSPKQIKPSLTKVKKRIVNTKITDLSRKAKMLIISLSSGDFLLVHLKMTGRLLFRKKSDPKDDWQHVTISLGRDHQLRFSDSRKFGWVKLVSEKEFENITKDFGPEPEEMSLAEFQKVLDSSSRTIKALLLDQQKISGVGNIYVLDALNLAKIDPRRPANKINQNEARKLLDSVKKVLKAGIRYRGASDQYYLDALGQKGFYQDHFLVYNREGKACFNCRGKIKKIKISGRGTYYCPSCQK